MYLVVVGYLVDGLLGACVAVIAVVLPPMPVLLLDRLRARLIHLRRFDPRSYRSGSASWRGSQ